jgi:predicted amidohydrolase
VTEAGEYEAPRKVVVGTCIYPMYQSQNPWPGLNGRLDQLTGLVDDMAAQAEGVSDTGLDLAVLPEAAVNAGLEGDAASVAFPLDGPVRARMADVARRHHCYIVLPMFLAEEDDGGYSNACVLLNRDGEPAGTYRKVFPVAARGQDLLEGGVTPGAEFPVFDCDFGRLGIQICFDGCFAEGWAALGAAGAELVVWPTMSPQTVRPALYAYQHGYHVISSTWRNNATIFRPNGMVAAQIRDPERLLVQQLDLSYSLLGWQPALRNGAIFTETYGSAAGFQYSEAEDNGIFWSNDAAHPIGRMIEDLGLETVAQVLTRNRALQDEARPGPVPGPKKRNGNK